MRPTYLQVQATDALSGVLRAFDTSIMEHNNMPCPHSLRRKMYGSTWSIPTNADGPHEIEFPAQDRQGNVFSPRDFSALMRTQTRRSWTFKRRTPVRKDPFKKLMPRPDPHLSNVSATLNGSSYVSGTPITGEGDYELVVSAADVCGHATTTTRNFLIDQTAPVISVTGVTDAAYIHHPTLRRNGR